MHRILATHPQIGSMPNEGQFFTDVLPLPQELDLPRLWAIRPELFYLDENGGRELNVTRLKRQWGAMLNDVRRPVVIEKSPTNAARLLWLQQHFPGAHFIAIVRNGYAVAEGIHRKAGHDIGLCAQQWATSNDILLRDLPKTKHHFLLTYEELAQSPQQKISEILQFIGLSEAQMGDVQRSSWAIHEQDSSIKNMNGKSFERLTEAELATIESAAGEVLTKLNYRRVPTENSK